MKTKMTGILSGIFTLAMLFSCEKEYNPKRAEFDLSDKILEIAEIKNVALKINELNISIRAEKLSQDEKDKLYQNELQLLIDNGRILFKEILRHTEFNNDSQQPNKDHSFLLTIEDQHLVELSLIMSFAYLYDFSGFEVMKSVEDWDADRVMNCMGAALGINEIAGIISNTAQLTTIQGTTQLLKAVGRRYLGWIGVAYGVYSFGKCMDAW